VIQAARSARCEEARQAWTSDIAVQLLHILDGSAWLGGSVFANLVLLPYVFGRPLDQQRELGKAGAAV
jgi:uncharacterized membrane protein